MDIDSTTLIWVAAAVLGIIGILIAMSKKQKVMNTNKWFLALPILLLAVGFSAYNMGYLDEWISQPQSVIRSGGSIAGGGISISGACNYQPTGSYSAKDKFSSISIAGTSYYKPSGLPATTTAASNLNKGTQYTYWVDNESSYVQPVTINADCGVNSFSADAWQNSSATVTGYDTVNHQSIADGAYNSSMGANALANLEITYQGTAKYSAAPFGGVLVLEYNDTMSSVTCNGDYITESNPYHVTYSPSSTSTTSKQYAFTTGLDDGSGNRRVINCQFKNGATAATTSPVYVKFYSADYYVTNAGNIVLDTQKYANDDTTSVSKSVPTLTFYWG